MSYIIRDMVSGELVGSEITRAPFNWHGSNGECRTKPAHGLELKAGESVVQKLYEINEAAGSAYTSPASPAYDSQTDSVTRAQDYKTLSACKAVKDGKINALRDAKRYPGNLATGLGWDVDLRNATDEKNIAGKVSLALSYKVASDATTIAFVGADNTARNLTADQMIAVGQAVDAHVSGVYAQSWAHKAAVAALSTAAEVAAYDETAGW